MTDASIIAGLDAILAAPSFGESARHAEDLRLALTGPGEPVGGFSLSDLTAEAMPLARAAIKASRPRGVFGFAGIPLLLILQTLLPILLPIILQVLALLFASKPAMLAALTSPAASDIDPAVRLAVEGGL